MLDMSFSDDGKLLLLKPQGALGPDDFATLTTRVNAHINDRDIVPNLVIQPVGLPHWDSIQAFSAHVKFVRDHHRLVQKVALVGDGLALNILPHMADLFVGAKLRRFAERHLDAAMEWAASDEDRPGGFEMIEGLPADVVAMRVKGIITSRDYREMLIPLIKEKLTQHDRLKALVVIDDAFDSYTPGAAWDDSWFGFSHLTDFGKMALVSDIGWIRASAKLFGPFLRGRLHVFDLAELDAAKEWIRS